MGWWSAGGVEREKRYGLFVGASGCALNEADKSGRADEPSGTKIVATRFGAVPGTNVAKTTRTMQRTATDLRVRRI